MAEETKNETPEYVIYESETTRKTREKYMVEQPAPKQDHVLYESKITRETRLKYTKDQEIVQSEYNELSEVEATNISPKESAHISAPTISTPKMEKERSNSIA